MGISAVEQLSSLNDVAESQPSGERISCSLSICSEVDSQVLLAVVRQRTQWQSPQSEQHVSQQV